MNDVADSNMLVVEVTLETSHFETSESNSRALLNAAELKKKEEKERESNRRSERIRETSH